MNITIEDKGEWVALVEKTISSSSILEIPITKAALIHGMKAILGDPLTTDLMVGPVMLVKTREGLSVNTTLGRFSIPYVHAFPLLSEDVA